MRWFVFIVPLIRVVNAKADGGDNAGGRAGFLYGFPATAPMSSLETNEVLPTTASNALKPAGLAWAEWASPVDSSLYI